MITDQGKNSEQNFQDVYRRNTFSLAQKYNFFLWNNLWTKYLQTTKIMYQIWPLGIQCQRMDEWVCHCLYYVFANRLIDYNILQLIY